MEKKLKEKQGASSWNSLFHTIKNLRLPWIWIIIGLAINLVANDLALDLPDTTADLLGGQLSGAAVTKAVFYYIMIGAMNTLAVAGQAQAQSYGVRKARESIWKKMLGMRMDYFDRNDPSDLMSAITNDASSAVESLVNVIIYLIPSIYYVVMALKRIGEYHWILALSCFAMIPIKYLYAFIMGRKYRNGMSMLYGKIGILTGFLADRILHLPLIKMYTNEEQEGKAGADASKKLFDANMRLIRLDNLSLGAASVIDILQKFIVVVVAVVLLQQRKIELSMWVAFFLFSQNLFLYIDAIFDSWTRIKTIQGTFERVIEIMEGDSEEIDATLSFPTEGDITFENVTFTYPETDKPALENISFNVPRGSSLAIVGLCGSGKTTSVSLLERLYDPDEGRILIGGTDIRDLSLLDYRRNISYVQQGSDIFGGTLRDALTYGIDREIKDDEIFEAAEKTGFNEYLKLCDNCLDTELASGASSMSGGQSQRLVLTREFLRGGDIILMDEPTSALDVRVSAKIQETTDKLFANKTRILVTHDLTFAKKYDKIIVMENGKMIGEGTHESLLKDCETYRQMNDNEKEGVTA